MGRYRLGGKVSDEFPDSCLAGIRTRYRGQRYRVSTSVGFSFPLEFTRFSLRKDNLI